uniref:Uncharacterized protein n=1 Tax=Anguilla anguilla TaxID=7936 RepID=A0A0E9RIH8_ANGAN
MHCISTIPFSYERYTVRRQLTVCFLWGPESCRHVQHTGQNQSRKERLSTKLCLVIKESDKQSSYCGT